MIGVECMSESPSGGNRHHPALDSVRPVLVGPQMLCPAHASAHAGVPAHDLCHQTLDVSCVTEEVTMTTVGGKDRVVRFEMSNHGKSRQLLADAGMHRAGQRALRVHAQKSLLHHPDRERPLEHCGIAEEEFAGLADPAASIDVGQRLFPVCLRDRSCYFALATSPSARSRKMWQPFCTTTLDPIRSPR